VDFGHMETVALISAPKYAEKQVCFLWYKPLLFVIPYLFQEHDDAIEYTC
jgi:hypothetical protein